MSFDCVRHNPESLCRFRLIGIAGKEGFGKSTAAKILAKSLGSKVIIRPMAKPLKEIVKILFCLQDNQVYGTQKEKNEIVPRFGLTPRQMLQKTGTELFREAFASVFPDIGEDVWLVNFETEYLQNQSVTFIVDDVRFPNEVEMIHRLGGFIIFIECPDITSTSSHKSEQLTWEDVKKSNEERSYRVINDFTKSFADTLRSL